MDTLTKRSKDDSSPALPGAAGSPVPPLDDLTAILIVEGESPTSRETYYRAWQHLVDTGLVWSLQGWYGRTARALIEAGHVQPGARP